MGIDGDLVIVQVNPVPGLAEFVRGATSSRTEAGGAMERRVRVYDASALRVLVETRSNGMVAVGGAPAIGDRMDIWLRKYRVRPGQDFLLLSACESTPDALSRSTQTASTSGSDSARSRVGDSWRGPGAPDHERSTCFTSSASDMCV